MSNVNDGASEPRACLETGCNNVECKHLTWGPPYCMLRVESVGTDRAIEPKPSFDRPAPHLR